MNRLFRISSLMCLLVAMAGGQVLPAFSETRIEKHKDWQIRTIIDDFTDEQKVVLNTMIDGLEEDFSSKRGIVLIGSLPVQPVSSAVTDMIVLKCDKEGATPYIVILTDELIEGHHTRNIEYRVDKQASRSILMKSHEKYLMIFDGRKVGRFLSHMRTGDLLIGRSKDKRGKPIKFRIPISGLEEIEHHFYSYCKRPR